MKSLLTSNIFANIEIKKNYKFFIKKNRISLFIRNLKVFKNELLNFFYFKFKKKQIKVIYNNFWEKISIDKISIEKFYLAKVWHVYKDNYFLAPRQLTFNIFKRLIVNDLLKQKPKNVLEVGCGIGYNIFFLAKKFPKVNFVGIDISESAIQYCNNILYNSSIKNVKFFQKNAKHLSLDLNFDITYTVLALEQMNKIKLDVMKNIIKITSKKIIFIEPFQNVNRNLFNYLHLKMNDYFDYDYKNLKELNLSIDEIVDDFPQRLGLAAQYISCRKLS